jgi:DNA replication protein DnaC
MDSQLITRVEKSLQQKRFQAELDYKNQIEHIYKLHPDLLKLENQKRMIVSERNIEKDEKNQKISSLNNQITSYLSKNNIMFPVMKYNCELCFDTGYLENGKRCDCFYRLASDFAVKDFDLDKLPTFDDFKLEIFDEEVRPTIKKWRNYLEEYSLHFPNVKKINNYICGTTGTGKTFLLSCIYSNLKKNGISVVYLTAGRLLDMLRKYAFDQITDIDILLDTEMLIIDDLGTEPLYNNITIEYLFLVFNERVKNNKAMCISSNLLPDSLKKRYTKRITSRILDKSITSIISIPGIDLRMKKL